MDLDWTRNSVLLLSMFEMIMFMRVFTSVCAVQRRWQEYIEPGDELDAASPAKRHSQHLADEDTDVLLPLGENTLTRNLGMDVIVVVTKVRAAALWPHQ